MKRLALETATEICSVAWQDGDNEIVEWRTESPNSHSDMLFVYLDRLFREQGVRPDDIDEILISGGPGAYTGLRIGAACVKGLLFTREAPLWSLGTLASLAAGVISREPVSGTVHAVVNARRQHLYYQPFSVKDNGLKTEPASVMKLEDIDRRINEGDRVVGTGIRRLATFGEPGIVFEGAEAVSARNLLLARQGELFRELFRKEDAGTYEPDYLTSWQPASRR